METKKILDSVFEGHNLTTAVCDGKIVWLAHELSKAMGYKNAHKLSNLIRQEWADEFDEGVHFVVEKHTRLRDCYAFEEPYYAHPKSRKVLLLTEPGVDLVIIKTRKPAGKRLRYHLSTVVLPQFRRRMIEERPVSELEAAYLKEISELKGKIIARDELVMKRDEQIMDANYRLGVIDGSVGKVRKSASLAGAALQAHRGTKKLREVN